MLGSCLQVLHHLVFHVASFEVAVPRLMFSRDPDQQLRFHLEKSFLLPTSSTVVWLQLRLDGAGQKVALLASPPQAQF